jgi:hypothetical protein
MPGRISLAFSGKAGAACSMPWCFPAASPPCRPGSPTPCVKSRRLGFRIGLHSAGMYPERLARVLPLVDWIGLDLKAPRAAYPRITGTPDSGDAVFASLRLILAPAWITNCAAPGTRTCCPPPI